MNIIYTGINEQFPPQYREKMETKLQKISKMIERKGEKEAHIILKHERFLHAVEITINMFDHRIVCYGEDAELLPAMNIALEKLEKQIVKLREKWRDNKRQAPVEGAGESTPAEPVAQAAASQAKGSVKPQPQTKAQGPRVYRVDHESDDRKPMTVDEAILEMNGTRNGKADYLVFRDAETDRLSVLMRRGDGNFDLIES